MRDFNETINTNSGLWETCPDLQYYDYISDIWRDWNGVCSYSWSYQKNCFKWSNNQYYDLETSSCVDLCDATKIAVNNTKFQNIPICKSLNIYVDSGSTSVIELGTVDNPYKNLLLAFIEIMNLHSHTNRTINIYVKTGTTLHVMPDYMYLINISKVNLLTYTSSSSSPARPQIYSVLSGVTLLSPKTMFNIISDTQINVTSLILNPALTTKEQSDLQTTYVGFMVNRCDFTIDSIDFTTNHGKSSKIFIWIKSVYEQSKSITLNNMNIAIGGNLLDSLDPLSLYLSNLNIDYYKNARGFYLYTQCNYTNASLSNEISIANITVFNSTTRVRSQTNSFLYVSTNANFTISNSSLNLFGSDTESYPQVYFTTSTGWNPNDGIIQYLTIQNTIFTLNQLSNNTRFLQLYSNIDASYYRKVIMNLNSLSFKGVIMNSVPIINFYANQKVALICNNFLLSDSTFVEDIIDIYNFGSILFNNNTFKNITKFGQSIITVSGGLNVNINGLTIDSWTLSTNDNYYYYQHISSAGYTNIAGLVMVNTDLKNRAAVYLSSVPSLTITSSSITASMIYPSNSIIQTGSLSELNINGFSLTQITSYVPGDNSDYIFSFDSLDLSKNTSFVINNMVVSQSQIAVINFNKVVNATSLTKSFTISNFQYSNSSFSDTNNLISLSKLEQSVNFTIIFTNISFSSISFNVSGNLMSFQQQLSNYVSISSLTITNTINASIALQANNKQNILLPVKVIISNLVTSNINAGLSSFINVNDNSILNITSSTIKSITSLDFGGAISINTATTQVYIRNSTISSNTASEGGAFFVTNSGVIKAFGSQLTSNYAPSSGLIKASNGGRFEFYGWTISSNYAAEAPIAILFDSSYPSILNSWAISNNTIGSYSGSNSYPIQLISSAITITNSTQISGQYSILSSFVSTITFQNSTLTSSSFNGTAIQVIGSTLYFYNMSIKNISQYQASGKGGDKSKNTPRYIQSWVSSQLYISNLTYTNSSLALFISQQSSGVVDNITVSSVNSYGFARIENALDATLSNWNINSSINNDTVYIIKSNIRYITILNFLLWSCIANQSLHH